MVEMNYEEYESYEGYENYENNRRLKAVIWFPAPSVRHYGRKPEIRLSKRCVAPILW
jgi:hypothetical protein